MAKHPLWSDEYWLLLMQIFLKKPVGVKPLYSRSIVNLSLELHIPPQYLYERLFRLRSINTPRMEKLWATYGNNPAKLSRGVKLLRQKSGFNNADAFYEGVEVNESFEKDFKPLEQEPRLTPMMLTMILDLYFQLTPITMVPETPEITDLAKLMKITPKMIADVMDVFQFCDPYLNRDDMMISPLLVSCHQIWQRFGNDNPEKLSSLAAQMKEYFK
jgi:hypothetical protein